MDTWDYTDRTQQNKKGLAIIWNLLTVIMLLSTLCVVVVFLMIFINPYSGFNLFPPATLPPALEFPTSTPTPRAVLPPTWTAEPSLSPTSTTPASPTSGLPPTETAFPLLTPSETAQGTGGQPTGGKPFALNSGSPVAISSVAFHPEAGCNWMGVAGQALNLSGAPVSTGVVIQLGGTLEGVAKQITSLTGTARQYGEAGYEIVLGNKPVSSRGTLWIQLLDQAGLPMSERVYFDTYEECDKNLIFINFRQVR